MEELRERARRLERERELVAERTRAEERLRLARELHDVVGHDVALIVVQAQVLGLEAGASEGARRAAGEIERLGREAMGEMHRTLDLLRPDAPAERAPQPGLGDLDALVERTRQAGVGVELRVEGAPRPLAPALELSAYRIVQEGLTNVVRHAGAASARVALRYGDDALELVVEDDGAGPPDGAPAAGHGLVGMRERAALFGGTLEAGPRDGPGFRVRAVLPIDGGRSGSQARA